MLRKFAAALAVLFLLLPGTFAQAQAGPGGKPDNAVGLWGQNSVTGAPCIIAPATAGSNVCVLPIGTGGGGFSASAPYDFTGLGKTGSVLNDDHFTLGPDGWMQLYTPLGTSTPWSNGSFGWLNDGNPRIIVTTPDLRHTAGNTLGLSGGIKRMSNVYGDGQYLVESLVAFTSQNLACDRPQSYVSELDTALNDATRRVFSVTFTQDGTNSCVYDVILGYGGTTATIGKYQLRFNENKILPVYLAYIVNSVTGTYDGLVINTTPNAGVGSNGLKLGLLNYAANVPLAQRTDTSLTDLGAVTPGGLASFRNGVNPFFEVYNRSDSDLTAGEFDILWQKTTRLNGLPNPAPVFGPTGRQPIVNMMYSNWALSGSTPIYTPDVKCNAGDIVTFDYFTEGVNGTPTTAALAITPQLAPWTIKGIQKDSYSSGIPRAWMDFTAADTGVGQLLVNGDFPAAIVSASTAARTAPASRSFKCTGLFNRIRYKMTPTFTGGTTPNITFTMSATTTPAPY